MGGNIGGHANCNPARTIDQHIWKTGRQHAWLFLFAVVIVLKINSIFVDIGQQITGRLVHPHFGIAHGGRVIAVH